MTYNSLPANPFVAAGMIEDSRLFVGRRDELQTIVSRMSGTQPTSVNICGDRRIGKSSLLYHFFLTWEQRVQNPSRYVVIYLSLQNAACQTEVGFYQQVKEGLLKSVPGWQIWVNNLLRNQPLNRQTFSDTIREWKQKGKLPVLCLDNFESLLKHPQEFDNGFYDNLRSLMEDNALMLVITSCKSLDIYGHEHRFVSRFFNIGHTLKLEELTTDDAMQLVRKVESSTNTPVLSLAAQNLAQQWGSRHPYKLQLAGYYLWEAKQNNKNIKWAKEQFNQKIAAMKPGNHTTSLPPLLRWLWDVPLHIGRLAAFIGGTWDDMQNRIIGGLVLIVIFFGVFKVLTSSEVQNWLAKIFNFVK